MTSVMMTRGINSLGKIVSINSVESGLQQNCFCLDCGARLVAKKAMIVQIIFLIIIQIP